MFNDFENVKKIGISGCELTIIDTNVVRKTSKSLEYNKRLKSQAEKQIKFQNLAKINIKTPIVLKTGFTENNFYFDMEYIKSEVPFDFFLSSTIEEIKLFVRKIQNYIDLIKKNITLVDISIFKEKTLNKLNELKEKSLFSKFIDFIIQELNKITQTSYPLSFCHGDLTLSNILCQNDDIYFIDLLDSFIDTPIVDIIKLKQDLVYHWSILILQKYTSNEILKLSQITNFIWTNLFNYNKDLINNELFDILESINYLRIEPYLSNTEMKENLTSIIKKTNLYEKFNNSNGRKIK